MRWVLSMSVSLVLTLRISNVCGGISMAMGSEMSVWVISKNSNTDARYQNCLMFWASRCIFASNSQHIIMFLDWILYFFWRLKWRPKFELELFCVFSNLPSYRIEFYFSMATRYMIIAQRLSFISLCSR